MAGKYKWALIKCEGGCNRTMYCMIISGKPICTKCKKKQEAGQPQPVEKKVLEFRTIGEQDNETLTKNDD